MLQGARSLEEVCEGCDALSGAKDCWEGDLRGCFFKLVSVWVVSGTLAQDVFPSLGRFTTGAIVLAIEGEAVSEFPCVSVASSTL